MISFEQFRPLIGSNRISILLHWSLALGRFIVNFTLLKFRTHIGHNLLPNLKQIQRMFSSHFPKKYIRNVQNRKLDFQTL